MDICRLEKELAVIARVERDVPLSRHTGFRTGGSAVLGVFPKTEEAFIAAAALLRKNGTKFYVVGKGMNLLALDGGYDGVILCTGEMSGIERAGGRSLLCPAGVSLREVCLFAADCGLGGLEFAYGIPGTAGGAVFMNAGAFGKEMKDVVDAVRILDEDGGIRALPGGACGFDYRASRFQSNRNELILSVSFLLETKSTEKIRRDMDDFINRRTEKQPLDYPSCGSAFRRPPGAYASELVDRCGLKGKTVGGAAVSEKHAGFVINRNHATSGDILRLMELVRSAVLEQTGYRLEREIEILE